MTSSDILRLILASGKPVYELRDNNPQALRRRLYKAARRRGYKWTFAISDDTVIVKVRT